jgi:hypothetical protein
MSASQSAAAVHKLIPLIVQQRSSAARLGVAVREEARENSFAVSSRFSMRKSSWIIYKIALQSPTYHPSELLGYLSITAYRTP